MNHQPELDLAASRVDTGWVQVMRPRLMDHLIADIGETAWAVYTILKAHADQHTGRSYPSQERIGDLIGKTPETVGVATRRLIQAGMLTKARRGRNNEYQLLESSPLINMTSGASHSSVSPTRPVSALFEQLALAPCDTRRDILRRLKRL